MSSAFMKEVVPETDEHKRIFILRELRLSPILVKAANPGTIFVFGDNLLREGKGGQAIIRDLPGTYGLRTKKAAGNAKADFFYDSDFFWFVRVVNEDLAALRVLHKQNDIVFHANGYGNGLAKLDKLAPQCYAYLNKALNEFCQGDYFG